MGSQDTRKSMDVRSDAMKRMIPGRIQTADLKAWNYRSFSIVSAVMWALYAVIVPSLIENVIVGISSFVHGEDMKDAVYMHLISAMAIILAGVLAVYIARRAYGLKLSLRSGWGVNAICSAVGTAMVMYALMKSILFLVEWLIIANGLTYTESFIQRPMDDWIAVGVLMAIVQPIVVEIIFRGIVLEKLLQRGYRAGGAVLVAALAIALMSAFMQLNIAAGIFTFASGLCLGILYAKKRSLAACMLANVLCSCVVFAQSNRFCV